MAGKLGREGIVMLLCRVVVTVVVAAGTYCQQREVEAITEGVEDDDGEWTRYSGRGIVHTYEYECADPRDTVV